MRVLVCGGRDYVNKDFLFDVLTELHTVQNICWDGITKIIEGGAQGADRLAREWAIEQEIAFDEYPANWKKHGQAAGHIRNKQMLDEGHPELVIAFPGGNGTANMIKQAKERGIKVIRAN